ncbi:hypothetical protein [Streptomyces sp. NPDC093109]|uniref:hypothetical protein n=1 Tax=Streptomyces sp. NPDC093109 TaxID=3154977 RepID=UPI00344C0FC2
MVGTAGAVNVERSHTVLRLIDELCERGEPALRVGCRPSLRRVDEHEKLTIRHIMDDTVFFTGYKLFLDDGWFATDDPRRADEYRHPSAAEAGWGNSACPRPSTCSRRCPAGAPPARSRTGWSMPAGCSPRTWPAARGCTSTWGADAQVSEVTAAQSAARW